MPVSKTNKNSTVLIKIQKETRGKSYSRNAFGLDWTPLKDPFSCSSTGILDCFPHGLFLSLMSHLAGLEACRSLGLTLA